MRTRPDLRIGRWLAREERDDDGGPPRIIWSRAARIPSDEVQATWADVLISVEVISLNDLEPVLSAAKHMQKILYMKAKEMGCLDDPTAEVGNEN